MRLLPAVLLLAAAPALAQQGPVDPDLVGTWAFEFFEAGDAEIPDNVQVEHLTLTFTADGHLRMEGAVWADGEREVPDTLEATFQTENGEIQPSEGPPARYEFVSPDELRIVMGPEGSLRFRRLSP